MFIKHQPYTRLNTCVHIYSFNLSLPLPPPLFSLSLSLSRTPSFAQTRLWQRPWIPYTVNKTLSFPFSEAATTWFAAVAPLVSKPLILNTGKVKQFKLIRDGENFQLRLCSWLETTKKMEKACLLIRSKFICICYASWDSDWLVQPRNVYRPDSKDSSQDSP